MADKPSRSLVIYGDGCASLLSPSHAHLHSFASFAACGFLALRIPPPTESENDRMVRELAHLLDAYEFYVGRTEKHDATQSDFKPEEISVQTISERFMGLKAAIITSCLGVASFARRLGLCVLQLSQFTSAESSDEPFHDVSCESAIGHKLLNLLGFVHGDILEEHEFDLVLLHIRTNEKLEINKEKTSINIDIDWINNLVGGIMERAQSGSKVASRLHVSVLMSYGLVSEADSGFFLIDTSTETNSDLSLFCPRQSYTMKGGHTLRDIRHHHPILLSQWQEGVTRRDMARSFSFSEFKEWGGNLALLADHFLHEVAFKLWKAPKYGA